MIFAGQTVGQGDSGTGTCLVMRCVVSARKQSATGIYPIWQAEYQIHQLSGSEIKPGKREGGDKVEKPDEKDEIDT